MADYFRKTKSLYSATTNSFGTGEGETITPTSVAGLPTDTQMVLTFDRTVAGKLERILGTISGGNFVIASGGRGYDGTTETSHTSPTVEYIPNAADINAVATGLLINHTQAGLHDLNGTEMILDADADTTITADTDDQIDIKIAGTDRFTLTATALKLGGDQEITDSSGNELLAFTKTASAVNELTVANAATGNNPVVSMTGGDSNVGLDLKMKGTAYFRKPVTIHVPCFGASSDVATGDGKAFFEVPEEINGMNMVACGAYVYTAGTTGTMDIQIRNVTDTQDMLSTKITIDSTEVSSRTAATAPVINTSYDDVVTGDRIAFDFDAVQTTKAKGAVVWMRFELP